MIVHNDRVPNVAAAAEHTNRLAQETSPYLLQHARNPVDWFPWGDEAFAKARKEDKPIFLSIGYSTCHWCHVMERESFENEDIAAILNEHFISIKVDREQRPDVDDVYMQAVQMMTGSGGWPLSVFLTPDGKPFYGGTYFPPRDMMGRPGFDRILLAVNDAWKSKREDLLASADNMTTLLAQEATAENRSAPNVETLTTARSQLERIFDPAYGGFGGAPKFPQPSTLLFLLRHYHRTADKASLEMVSKTLDAMAAGGIHDHLGGGFHRYSTDPTWLVPHFEKMLYDQALLSRTYVEAWQITDNKRYAQTARDVFDYVLREMTDSQGGFYSAEDADSEGSEGTFYVWQPDDIAALLGDETAQLFNARYGVTKQGNFEHGESILSIVKSEAQLARQFKKEPGEIQRTLADARQKLLAKRAARPRPHLDDKVIAGWNGLMIWAMAYGGRALDDAKYIDAAERAADFVLTKLRVNGRLQRYYRSGRASESAFLDDHAFMVLGLLELYQASFDPRWLADARSLAEDMIELFHDSDTGGFFLSASDRPQLIARRKPAYDGAVPSGNSVATLALLRLAHVTRENRFSKVAEQSLSLHSARIHSSPTSLTAMLMAVDFQLGPRREIVVAGDRGKEDTKKMLRAVQSRFLPRTAVILREPGEAGKAIESLISGVEGISIVDGQATAYLCEGFVCKAPVDNVQDLEKSLSNREY